MLTQAALTPLNFPDHFMPRYVAALNLIALGFAGVTPAATCQPSYHPTVLLKIYIYGYLNRIQSSRRFVMLCCAFKLFIQALVAIDGSRSKIASSAISMP